MSLDLILVLSCSITFQWLQCQKECQIPVKSGLGVCLSLYLLLFFRLSLLGCQFRFLNFLLLLLLGFFSVVFSGSLILLFFLFLVCFSYLSILLSFSRVSALDFLGSIFLES